MRRPEKGHMERLRDERGFVLLIVMIIIAALALLGLAANRNILTDVGIAENHGGNTRAFYAAEAAAQYAYNQLYQTLGSAGTVPVGGIDYTASAPSMTASGCTITSVQVGAPTAAVQRKISATSKNLANFNGLNSWVTTYTITAQAKDANSNAVSNVALDVVNTLIPIFQFGIFYNSDLEMNPGANLTIPNNGWIHTNSNLYTSTSATETINSNITSAGEIRHGRKAGDPQAVGTGNVSIEGANGTYYNLQDGSETLSGSTWVSNKNWPKTVSQWATTTSATVAAQEEGVQSLNLPLPAAAASNPEYILNQTGPQTMGSKAAVVVTNGIASDAKGNTLSTCYYNASHKSGSSLKVDPGCTSGANQNSVTAGTVYDYREGKTAETYDIDVAGFQASAAGVYLATSTPANGGTSGVLYATSTNSTTGSQFNAIRLVDGNVLSSPLTVATDLPAYVQGNYNKGDSSHPIQASAIMADATTVLSNEWQNSYSSSTSLNNRPVNSALTINADIMTGNQATTSAGYGGGFENFIRFLENWSNENYNFGGSLVCMWQSTKAVGQWQNTGVYYNAPVRQYTFGVFGTSWPPGTPYVHDTSKGTWRQY